MRELHSASLRLIIFMSILASCGALIPRVMLVGMDPAIAGAGIA